MFKMTSRLFSFSLSCLLLAGMTGCTKCSDKAPTNSGSSASDSSAKAAYIAKLDEMCKKSYDKEDPALDELVANKQNTPEGRLAFTTSLLKMGADSEEALIKELQAVPAPSEAAGINEVFAAQTKWIESQRSFADSIQGDIGEERLKQLKDANMALAKNKSEVAKNYGFKNCFLLPEGAPAR